IHWRLPPTTIERLTPAVESYPGRRGKPAMRRALHRLDGRSDSRRESHLRLVIVEAGLGGLVTNLDIITRDGTKYRADFAFPQAKLLVEYQSDYHAGTEQFRRDMTRIAKLQ